MRGIGNPNVAQVYFVLPRAAQTRIEWTQPHMVKRPFGAGLAETTKKAPC